MGTGQDLNEEIRSSRPPAVVLLVFFLTVLSGCATTRIVAVDPAANSRLDPDKLRAGTHIVAYTTTDGVRHPFVGYAHLVDAQTWRLTPQAHGGRTLDLPRGEVLALEVEGSVSFAPDRPRPRSQAWYGAPMLLIDASAWATLAILSGISEDDRIGYVIAGAGYLIGGPTVHIVRGNPGRAAGSVGLRLGCAAIVASSVSVVTYYGCWYTCDPDTETGLLVGAGALLVAAQLIDDLILARDYRIDGSRRHVTFTPEIRDGRLGMQLVAQRRF